MNRVLLIVSFAVACGPKVKVFATVHARRFAPDLLVARVGGHRGDRRSYQIEHAGKSAQVAPAVFDAALAGTPVLGDWVLTSPLLAGEACGTPTLPRNLVID